MELFSKMGGSMAHCHVQAIRLFKTYCIRLRDLKTISNDFLKLVKHIIDKSSGRVKFEDYLDVLNLKDYEEELKSQFFEENREKLVYIDMLMAVEGVLKIRENISTQLIEGLDVDKIIQLVNN